MSSGVKLYWEKDDAVKDKHFISSTGQGIGQKDTNPKDALGIKKVPISCLPTQPVLEVALAMFEGGRKYGRHNYRAIGTRASVYYDAIGRHITAWWEGEDIDPDSGVHHLIKAAACCLVHRDSMIMGNDVDDRPPRYPYLLDMKTLNEQTKKLIEQYPICVEPYTHRGHVAKPQEGQTDAKQD